MAQLTTVLALVASIFTAGPAHADANQPSPSAANQPADEAPKRAPAKARKYTLEGQLNINTAGTDEWVLLPGIGPSTAAKIVAYREQTPFESLDELVKVRGIGRKTLGRIRGYLKMSGDSDLKRTKSPARS